MNSEADEDSSTMKIMIATDIHLGVNEKDAIRADDSFNTFEEILNISKEQDVDFILLGGDLFHDNKPSPQCLYKCLTLLRKYCMGDKPIHIEFLSDQDIVFKNCPFRTVNYEDPNMNISFPIFSIHGNHDDPSGFGRKSAMDILSVSGYVNYFGKWTDLNNVKIHPLMLKKGSTKLAIYGLSHIKDDRLYRLMKHNEVEYIFPERSADKFFNLMVLHQNRAERPGTNHIPESLIPSFIKLVIWGHEHDCHIEKQWNQEKQFFVVQPGSSVATSLSEGESLQKHVGILKIKHLDFELEQIPLKTVRPFVFDSVRLSDWNMRLVGKSPSDIVQEYVDRYIRSKLLEKVNDLKTGHPNQPELPLIRLKIEFEEESECFNARRFGQTFTGVVANPEEMVKMKRKLSSKRVPRKGNKPSDDIESAIQDINISMSDLIDQYFETCENAHMKVLSRSWLAEGVARFIDKEDKEAIDDIIYHEMKKSRNYLETKNADADNIKECLEQFVDLRLNRTDEEVEEVRRLLESDDRSKRENAGSVQTVTHVDIPSDDDDFAPSISELNGTSGRGRGRGSRSRGSRGTRGSSTRGRGTRSSNMGRQDETSSSRQNVTRRSSRTSSSSSTTTITSYLRPNESRRISSDEDDNISAPNGYKPSPKKKMKFTYVEDDD